MNHVTHPLSYANIIILSQEIIKLCYIKKYRYIYAFWYIIFHSFNFFWAFNDCFNKVMKQTSATMTETYYNIL